MTKGQFRTAIETLGLTQADAAEFLGVCPRTGQNYALGKSRVPEGFAKLLRLMIKRKIKPEDVE